MGKIIVSENVTLDGGVLDPTGEEGTEREVGSPGRDRRPRGVRPSRARRGARRRGLPDWRRTYEFLASRWPTRPGPLAERLNRLPKYVLSATLSNPAWTNTTVVSGDPVAEVAALKGQIDGEIVVPASFQLVRTLVEHDLVDELRIMVYPVLLGTGTSLFGQLAEQVPLRRIDHRAIGDHLSYTAYEIDRADSTHAAFRTGDQAPRG